MVGFERLNPLMSLARVWSFIISAHFHRPECLQASAQGQERSYIIATLQMEKLRVGEIQSLLQGHRNSKWQVF